MQLTIDSNQPLDDVLRVIGAMYDVQLSAGYTNGGAARGRPTTRSSKRATRARRRPRASTAEMREWAVKNGYTVGTKGRIPASVVTAFQAAH